MKIFNNVTDIVRDDMAENIKKGSKVSIAGSMFFNVCIQRIKKAVGRD